MVQLKLPFYVLLYLRVLVYDEAICLPHWVMVAIVSRHARRVQFKLLVFVHEDFHSLVTFQQVLVCSFLLEFATITQLFPKCVEKCAPFYHGIKASVVVNDICISASSILPIVNLLVR